MNSPADFSPTQPPPADGLPAAPSPQTTAPQAADAAAPAAVGMGAPRIVQLDAKQAAGAAPARQALSVRAVAGFVRRYFSAPPDLADMPGMDDFERAAEHVMSRQRTQRAQQLVRLTALAIVLLLIWAAFARVDEVTKGDGRVIPSRQLQVLQSLDGGVVSDILVREGQVVEAGQLLLKIDETRATSGVRESAAQGFSLRARGARLRALAEGSAFKPLPPTRRRSTSWRKSAASMNPR